MVTVQVVYKLQQSVEYLRLPPPQHVIIVGLCYVSACSL